MPLRTMLRGLFGLIVLCCSRTRLTICGVQKWVKPQCGSSVALDLVPTPAGGTSAQDEIFRQAEAFNSMHAIYDSPMQVIQPD